MLKKLSYNNGFVKKFNFESLSHPLQPSLSLLLQPSHKTIIEADFKGWLTVIEVGLPDLRIAAGLVSCRGPKRRDKITKHTTIIPFPLWEKPNI